jgi:hypothetical protein
VTRVAACSPAGMRGSEPGVQEVTGVASVAPRDGF